MSYDCIVVGGGPAGMFAAITAAQNGKKVLLLEKNDRLGKKLLITGKGRCNVTNDCTAQDVLQNTPRNGRFLYSAMTAFPPEKIKTFFEERGCALKTERGNRVFPVSDSARSILECLHNELRRCKVTVKTARVKGIAAENDVVMDGRDIGTCVLPNADTKVYLTASSAVRAKRRFDELTQKGESCDLQKIEEDIIERDHRDMTREISPLKQAEDAVLVDSSDMTIDEVVEKIISLCK